MEVNCMLQAGVWQVVDCLICEMEKMLMKLIIVITKLQRLEVKLDLFGLHVQNKYWVGSLEKVKILWGAKTLVNIFI